MRVATNLSRVIVETTGSPCTILDRRRQRLPWTLGMAAVPPVARSCRALLHRTWPSCGVVPLHLRSGDPVSTFLSHRSCGPERQKQLWEELFSNPSEWWDNRLDKRGPRHPDFRHKLTKEPLWLNSEHKPSWVETELASLDVQGKYDWRELPGLYGPGLFDEGQMEKVLGNLDDLGSGASVNMYRSILKACAKRKALAQARRVHSHLAKTVVEYTKFLGESVVSTLVKCGGLEDALHVFDSLPHRTVFSFTAVISGFTTTGQGREALRVYRCMQAEGLKPNKYTFLSLVKACASISNLEEGRRIHADVLKYGCDRDVFVGTGLVDMFAKCGSIVDAQNVFDGMPERNVVSWNAMLAAYSQRGEPEKALQLYGGMRDEGPSPNNRSFVSALQACRMLAEKEKGVTVEGRVTKLWALEQGKTIHADAQRKGYDADVFVGNTLISMYGKCGSIVHARNVFDNLPLRDVVSWNAMIASHVQQDQPEKALQLYQQLQDEGVSPNDRTFVSVIPACGMLAEKEDDIVAHQQSTKEKYLERGKAIHHDAHLKGYDADVFIGSALVSMYGKCGSLVDAESVFNRLSSKDVVPWNAMLVVYSQLCQAEQALELYEQMREEGIIPDDRTFVTVIQACGQLAEEEDDCIVDGQSIRQLSLQKGKAIHADAWKKGYSFDVFVGNTLVSMYGKCGAISNSHTVFDGLLEKNAVSWNAMLAAYVELNHEQRAWQLYEQMLSEGVMADDRTFVTVLQACGMLADKEQHDVTDGQSIRAMSLTKGKILHAEAWRKGHSSDVFVGNTLVSIYGKCKDILDAQYVFRDLFQRSLVSWNAMLAAHVEQGRAEKALELYDQMQDGAVSPDVWTYVSTLQACSIYADKEENVVLDGRSIKVKCLQKGKALHASAERKGHGSDVFLSNTLISMYGRCGSILDAHQVFDGLSQRDLVSCNAMLAAYAHDSDVEKAFLLYKQMKGEGVHPDDVTIVCLLQACSNSGSLDLCREIHNILVYTKTELSLLLANTLIHAYGTCSSMVDAQTVFATLPNPDVVSWTALIAGYARQGDSLASLQRYDEMQLAGIRPNSVTFLSALSACSHAGLVDKGIEYFESMTRVHGITPGVEHYVTMVDLLGRAGYFTRVERLLSDMPVQPSLAIWLCLLGACRKHGKTVLGRRAFDRAVLLEPQHPAAYVLMWNIYADAGLWEYANEVTQLRQKGSAWKKPGQSWIEHEQGVHSFLVGNRKDVQHKQLIDLVGRVNIGLEQLIPLQF